MSKKDNDSGKVEEPRTTYRTSRLTKSRRPVKDIVKDIRRIRKKYAGRGPTGKDVVTLVREERER